MDNVTYIKSFSKGQITVPKDIRESLGISDEFWLKMYVDAGKIIAEPVEKKKDVLSFQKKLLAIKGRWINAKEIVRNRKQVDRKIAARAL